MEMSSFLLKTVFNHNLRLYSLMTTRPSDLEKHAGKGA